ncbi:mCG145090, partial [Mus musculus]
QDSRAFAIICGIKQVSIRILGGFFSLFRRSFNQGRKTLTPHSPHNSQSPKRCIFLPEASPPSGTFLAKKMRSQALQMLPLRCASARISEPSGRSNSWTASKWKCSQNNHVSGTGYTD